MEHDRAPLGRPPMLEEIDRLPRAERQMAAFDRYSDLRLRQRRPQMGGHVVGALGAMPVAAGRLRGDGLEEGLQVGAYLRVRVLLDNERRRGVRTEQGEKS